MTRTSNVPLATFEYFARQSLTSDVPTTTPASDSSLDASGSNAVTVHGRSSASEVSTDILKESRHVESGASFEVPVLPSKPPQLAPSEHAFAPAHCGDYEYHGIPMISDPLDSTMTAVEQQRPTSSPPLANPLREQDTTGQTAPPGRTPRITALLWEDEGCMCFQVEAKNKAVQRRDDNHMINGTRLLMVAGVDRVSRDMMLKSEKMRHVVKFAPEHSKGVWIPFDRALDLANQYGVTESLYPLFVHNIGALLYHPVNQPFSGI